VLLSVSVSFLALHRCKLFFLNTMMCSSPVYSREKMFLVAILMVYDEQGNKNYKVLAAALTVERGAGITNHMFLHGENQLTDQNSCVDTWVS